MSVRDMYDDYQSHIRGIFRHESRVIERKMPQDGAFMSVFIRLLGLFFQQGQHIAQHADHAVAIIGAAQGDTGL
jgi:hypothetical protein